MNYVFILLLLFCTIRTEAQQTVPIFDFSKFENRVLHKNDTLYVVNFWATWCKPCVAELPLFENARQAFAAKPVKIILVSQDAKARAAQVYDFLNNNKYSSESFILSAGNPNVWIDKIDKNWSGVIPMTIFYKNGTKVYFHEGDYPSQEVLEKIIHTKL